MQSIKKQKSTFKPLSNPTAQAIFDDALAAGYPLQLSKQQYAEFVGCSRSAVDNYISKGYGVPNYRKIGNARNSRVMFSLRDVAEYLASQTIQTL